MAAELAGQVAIVTGGGRGIGRAVARALAAAGTAVMVSARTEDQLTETVGLIERTGGVARAHPADVTDGAAVDELVKDTERRLGPVDLLVNNAGNIGAVGPLWEVDPEVWWRVMEVNVRGVMLCSRAVLPGMIARRCGRIINVASGSSLGPLPAMSGYATSKTAVVRLTEHLAADTQPTASASSRSCPAWCTPTWRPSCWNRRKGSGGHRNTAGRTRSGMCPRSRPGNSAVSWPRVRPMASAAAWSRSRTI